MLVLCQEFYTVYKLFQNVYLNINFFYLFDSDILSIFTLKKSIFSTIDCCNKHSTDFVFFFLFQYSQYPYNHLGQTAGSGHYSAQSAMYLQTAPQPHPPPGAAQAPPDIYSSMNSYRLSATAPFGQNQQLNNPTTVLISSTSNSLMSASVKPSSQQISAIGK